MAYSALKPQMPNFTFSLEHLPYKGLNLIEIIEQEHRFVEALFERYKQAESLLEKQDLAFHTIRALICHSICEETTFYPTLRWKFPDGNKVADSLIAEHLHMRDTLSRLDAMDPSDPEFDLEYQRVVVETINHTREHEEKTVLPRFRKMFSDTALLEMASHWRECMQSVHHHHREQQAQKEASKVQEMREPLKSMPGAHVDKNEHARHFDQGTEKDRSAQQPMSMDVEKQQVQHSLSQPEHAIPMQAPLKSMPGAHVDKNEHMTHHYMGQMSGGSAQQHAVFGKKQGGSEHNMPNVHDQQPQPQQQHQQAQSQSRSYKGPHVINIQ